MCSKELNLALLATTSSSLPIGVLPPPPPPMADHFDHLKTDVPFSSTNNAVNTGVLSIASIENQTYGPFHYWVANGAIINEATSYFSSRGLDVVKFTPFTNRATWTRINSIHAPLQTVDLTVHDPNESAPY